MAMGDKSVSITVSADQKHRTRAFADSIPKVDGLSDFKIEKVMEEFGLIFGSVPEELLRVIAGLQGVKAVEIQDKVSVSPLKPEPVMTTDPYFFALAKRKAD